jgi:hypothetical protein
MDSKAKKLLFDIQTAIANVNNYVGEEKVFEKMIIIRCYRMP